MRKFLFIFATFITILFMPNVNAASRISESVFYANGQKIERGAFVNINSNDFTFKVYPTYTVNASDYTSDARVGQTFTDEVYMVVAGGELTLSGGRCNNVAVSVRDLGYQAPLPNSTWMFGEVYLFTITWTAKDSGDFDNDTTWFDTTSCTITLHNNNCCPWYMGYNTLNQSVGTSTNLNTAGQQQQAELIRQTKEGENTRKGIWQSLKDGISSIGTWFSDLAGSIGNFFSQLGDRIGSFFSSLGDRISGFFTSLGDRIGGFFTTLLDGIINGLKSLFIPDSGYFSSYFNELWDFFNDKLGILLYPLDLLLSILNRFVNLSDSTNGLIHIPSISIGSFGEIVAEREFYINEHWMEEPYNKIYNIYKIFVNCFIGFCLINLAKKKQKEIVGGQDSDN